MLAVTTTAGDELVDIGQMGAEITRVVPKVMSNFFFFFLHANWEQQMKESAVLDGTSCCVILECLVTPIDCIT